VHYIRVYAYRPQSSRVRSGSRRRAEAETNEDDHAALAPRLGTPTAGEAEAGGEDVARIERAVARDSDAELGDGEHTDERLDRARGGASPEPLPDLLAHE
jgi:hypothetical protein